MNITTYKIKTNDKFLLNKYTYAANIISIECDNINDLDQLIIYCAGFTFWSIDFKSILLDINKIIIENNKIIFSNDLFFQNDDYIYIYLTQYHSINIEIKSNKSLDCKINLIHKTITKDNSLNIYEQNYFNINDYNYKKLNGKKIINYKYMGNFGIEHEDYFQYINSFYMKGSRIYKIYYNENINYKIIKKNIIFNDKNIRIIKTVKLLNLIKDVENIILEYCDIYEYLYKLNFQTQKNNIYTELKFDKEFYGEILIIRDNKIITRSGMGCKAKYYILDI